MNNVYSEMEQLFKNYPGVIYGFSNTEFSRFAGRYRCALVFGVPHNRPMTLKSYSEEKLESLIAEAKKTVNSISVDLKKFLSANSIEYAFPPVAQASEESLLAPFSFKHAAVNAGLGWIGKNDILITQRYGPRLRLAAVLIDYPFPLGTPVVNSQCPTGCFRCVDACPHKALAGTQWNLDSERDQLIDYHHCNQMRSLYLKTYDRKHACGYCLVACPKGLKSQR